MEENQKNEEKKRGKSSLAIFIILLLIVIVAGTIYIIITGVEKNSKAESKTNNNTKISQNTIKNLDNTNNVIQNNSSNNAQQNTNEEFVNQLNSIEMASFNAQFTSYSGTGLTTSQIKALISSIKASNMTDKNHIVTVKTQGDNFTSEILFPEGTNKDEDLEKIRTEIKAGEKFTVELAYDENGFINVITIK